MVYIMYTVLKLCDIGASAWVFRYTVSHQFLPKKAIAKALLIFVSGKHEPSNATAGNLTANIAILTILSGDTTKAKYKTAMDTMECYALQNSYQYFILNDRDYKAICEHKDSTFRRHCIVAHILHLYSFEWVLFVDGDIGIVNEKTRLEEYIKNNADIIFYERFFNFEVMAGSYFAKKTAFAMMFLRGWADYEFRLPKNFHGQDNGALHMWLMELLAPNAPLTPACWILWRKTRDFETLTRFTLCAREALRNLTSSQVFVYKKGEGWARDSWLTNSHWNSQTDFMFHSLKEKHKQPFSSEQKGKLRGTRVWGPLWFDTLSAPLNLTNCRIGREIWNHETALIVDKELIESRLENWRELIQEEYKIKLKFLQNFILTTHLTL